MCGEQDLLKTKCSKEKCILRRLHNSILRRLHIFVGYHESKLFSCVQKPTIYFQYVDDTFAIFKQEGDTDDFLVTLNRLHPALKFTFEKEHDGKLPFLDILVERTEHGCKTSIYRRPTFSGQYIRWEFFISRKRKTNLIATLVHRALMICTKNKLKQEIDFIKKILLDNGYPEDIVLKHISTKIAQFSTAKPFDQKSVQCTLEPQG